VHVEGDGRANIDIAVNLLMMPGGLWLLSQDGMDG
jgi:hypothetical protein